MLLSKAAIVNKRGFDNVCCNNVFYNYYETD